MCKRFFTGTFIASLLALSGGLHAQKQSAISKPYQFKATHLGMSLAEFKKTMAGDKVTVTTAIQHTGLFANAKWKKQSETQILDTPVCFNGERDGEISCNATPEASNPQFRTVAGVPMGSIIYNFYKERLYSIKMDAIAAFFDQLTLAFTEKYGAPKEMPASHYQNGSGATWIGRNYVWQRESQEILWTEGIGNGPKEAGALLAIIPGTSEAIIIDNALAPPSEKEKPLDF